MENQNYPYIDLIKSIMAEKRMNQQRFADEIGVNQTTVSQWLRGRKSLRTTVFLLFAGVSTLRPTSFLTFKFFIKVKRNFYIRFFRP